MSYESTRSSLKSLLNVVENCRIDAYAVHMGSIPELQVKEGEFLRVCSGQAARVTESNECETHYRSEMDGLNVTLCCVAGPSGRDIGDVVQVTAELFASEAATAEKQESRTRANTHYLG